MLRFGLLDADAEVDLAFRNRTGSRDKEVSRWRHACIAPLWPSASWPSSSRGWARASSGA